MHQKTTLPNGLRIVTTTSPTARSVSIALFLGVGSRYEAEEVQGISHFAEHMVFKGTTKRPSAKDISIAIESLGGIINAETSKEATVYWVKVAARHWEAALDVLGDIVRHPLVEPAELEKERRVIVEELSMLLDSPHEWVHVLMDEVLWDGHPLGRDVGGTRESVEAMTRDQMVGFIGRHYVPTNTVVSVAGPIDHERIVEEVERQLGEWQSGEVPTWGPVPASVGGAQVRLKTKKTEQAHFCLAAPAMSYLHPDRFTLDLVNAILGEGMSSRLFLEVRERLGLTYDVHSYLNRYRDTGSAVIYAGVDPSKMDKALTAVVEELGRLRHDASDEELHRARDYWKGRLELRLEDTRSLASWIGSQELLLGRIFEVDDVVASIDRVTIQDVRRVVNDVFGPGSLKLAVIGPFRKADQFLRRLEA